VVNIPSYQNAEILRRSGKYTEALDQFAQLWQQNPNCLVGWRYAFCLRKVGRLEDAERIAREALEKCPGDKFTRAELGWILYEKELKPAKEEGDLDRIVRVASQILALNSDGIILAKVVLAVMRVAKGRGRWETLLEWADRLVPENLNNQPMTFGGKRGMSDRETWYVGRARALLELGRYKEARQFAQSGLAEFPDDIFLRRTAALALARSGDLMGGIVEMRALLEHRRADWYMKAELAELEYQAANYVEAYRLVCEALLQSHQSDEYRVGYFVILARIALALGKLEVAAAHVALVKAMRSSRGWRIPPDLVQLSNEIDRALQKSNQKQPELPQDLVQLRKLCRRHWQEGKDEGLQFYRGTVKPYPQGRHFTYIQRDDGGDDVYVIVRDLPMGCNQPGSRVEFALKVSFDKKKGRESVQAINLRCLRE
jgi:tetratricopeptide (TPR) repeat protein